MSPQTIKFLESQYGIEFEKEYPIREIANVNSLTDADTFLRYKLADLFYNEFPTGKLISELNGYQLLLNDRHRKLSKKPSPNDNDCALLIAYYFVIIQISTWVKRLEATNCSAATGYDKMTNLFLPKLKTFEPKETERKEINFHIKGDNMNMDILSSFRFPDGFFDNYTKYNTGRDETENDEPNNFESEPE